MELKEQEFELSVYISVTFVFLFCLLFELGGIRVIRVRVNRVKMTGKWVEIQGKLD